MYKDVRLILLVPPLQAKSPHQIKMNNLDWKALEAIIKVLEEQKLIEKSILEYGDFVNNVFLREKKVAPKEDLVKKQNCLECKRSLCLFILRWTALSYALTLGLQSATWLD